MPTKTPKRRPPLNNRLILTDYVTEQAYVVDMKYVWFLGAVTEAAGLGAVAVVAPCEVVKHSRPCGIHGSHGCLWTLHVCTSAVLTNANFAQLQVSLAISKTTLGFRLAFRKFSNTYYVFPL
jgi:hypothetical protein